MKATRCSPCRSAPRRARLPDRGVRRHIRRDDGSGRFGVPGGQRPEGDRRSGCGDACAAVLGRGAEHGGRSGSAGLFRADAVTGAGGQRYGEQRAGCRDLLDDGDGRRGADRRCGRRGPGHDARFRVMNMQKASSGEHPPGAFFAFYFALCRNTGGACAAYFL